MTEQNAQEPRVRRHACDRCSRSFARPEHLLRHVRTHTREKAFQCSVCGKGFGRQDVLTRHSQSHEVGPSGGQAAAFPRACLPCAARRVRCPRGVPCKNCANKKLSCSYPTGNSEVQRHSAEISQETANMFSREAGRLHDAQPGGDLHNDSIMVSTEPDLPNETSAGALQRLNQIAPRNDGPEALAMAESGHPGQGDFANVFDSTVMLNGASVTNQQSYELGIDYNLDFQIQNLLSINWMSPEYQSALGWHLYPGDPQSNSEPTGSAISVDMGEVPSGVYHDLPQNNMQMNTTSPENPGQQDEQHTPSCSVSSTIGSSASRQKNRLYVESEGARAPSGHTHHEQRLNDAEPDDSSQRDGMLSDSCHKSAKNYITRQSYDAFNGGLQAEAQAIDWQIDMAALPSQPQLETRIRSYFEKFHPSFPFLRKRPFLTGNGQDWILILAIAEVGACCSAVNVETARGSPLLDLLRTVLTDKLDLISGKDTLSETSDSDDLSMVQASILYIICALHGGEPETKRRALADRVRLVDACHSLSLLSGGKSPSISQSFPRCPNLDSTWILRQAKLRTGLMIWLLDFLLACEFQCRPLMRLTDVSVPLPCAEDVWEGFATDASLKPNEPFVTLLEGLEMLYMEKRLPAGISEFGKVLLIYGVCRKTKEVLSEGLCQLSTWTPTAQIQRRTPAVTADEPRLALAPALSRWRNSACDCLDILHWSANSKAAASAGWEHSTILHLHLSRLIILTPLAHIRMLATEHRAGVRAEESKKNIRTAQIHVDHWIMRDHFKARLAVVHAGATFWHLRRYSTGLFLEPYAVFSATLVLWAYSLSLQSLGNGAATPDISTAPEVPPRTSASTPSVARVLAQYDIGEQPSLIYIDRPCDDEMVQAFVQSGSTMTGYLSRVGDMKSAGAPQRILQAGHQLLRYCGGQALDTSHPRIQIPPSTPNTRNWDIAQYYAEILDSVARRS